MLFGHSVASVFLFLSGFGLVLARSHGQTPFAALRRISVVAGAALLVTVLTAFVAPGQAVLFGILHCIAVTNLIALPLLQVRTTVILATAAIALLIPMLVPGDGWPALWWLGVSEQIPDTLDYRPVLPWLALVLLGVAFGQRGGARLMRRVGCADEGFAGALAALGRHSLAVYLMHQPVLFGLLSVATWVHPPQAGPSVIEALGARCQAACVKKGADPALCANRCACVRDRIASASGPLTPDDLAAACRPH